MKKDEMIISTLPIKPQKSTNIGMMIAPTIMDYVGDVLEIEKNIGFNILHTYDDKTESLSNYLEYVKYSGINYDNIFIDKDHADKLLEIVADMVKNKHIIESEKEIIRCECGKVDMISSNNKHGKLFELKDGKTFCKHCGKECVKKKELCLTYNTGKKKNGISIAPLFLKKDVDELENNFLDEEILVSKARNTGYSIQIENRKYNIDVDFLWSNYFKLYNNSSQIYIASNHQLFNMYLMNNIAKNTSLINLSFIASPYLDLDLNEAKRQYELRKLKEYKSLLILYNLKWKNKNCHWADSTTQYLSTLSDTKLVNLYKSMIISSREEDSEKLLLDSYLNQTLNNKTNMQNNIKTMKKLFNDGKL